MSYRVVKCIYIYLGVKKRKCGGEKKKIEKKFKFSEKKSNKYF